MPETKRMAEEATRMGEEAQEQTIRVGHEYQKAVESGVEAASRSFGEVNRGLQALAAEMTDYSKKAFDDAIRTWEQLIGVKSLEQAIQIQSQYAKKSSRTTWPSFLNSVRSVSAWCAMPLSQANRLRNGSLRAGYTKGTLRFGRRSRGREPHPSNRMLPVQ